MSLISYAQNFEDVRLWRAFADVSAGRYLDIGTQDPVQDSVSLAFYERGWRGVHVEPTSAYAAALRTARPDETVIEAAVSAVQGPLRFFEIPATGLSTGKPEIAKRHEASGWKYREIAVPTVTLAGIFDLMGPDLIHWMKIDVEGMEEDVLASWGEHPARPAALVIEATAPGTQHPTHEVWHELVTAKGYLDVLFDGLSRYFIHESHAARGEALALSPNVFDGYQVHQGHFAAQYLWQKRDADLAALRHELEEEQERQARLISEQLLEVSAQHELVVAGILEETEAALAELERHRTSLEEQAEESTASLAETRAAAAQTAERLETTENELARLERQLVEEVEAHIGTKERAQADAIQAAAALNVAREQLANLEADAEELARNSAKALALAQNETAKLGRVLEEAATRLEALQQDHLLLVRENGVLEGLMAAQERAHATRLAASVATRRQLSGQLRRAELALETAQAEAVRLRYELSLQARQYEDALGSADRRYAQAEEALNQADEDRDTLRQTLVETQHRLADQVGLNSVGEVQRSAVLAERDCMLEELCAVREQASSDALALNNRLTQLQHHIEWRERQLHDATALLVSIPQPLAGLPRIVAALARPWRSRAELAVIANHRTALDYFWTHLLLPPMPEMSHGAEGSSADQTNDAFAAIETRGVQNMQSDEPVTSVPVLLTPHDREFIRAAYQAVLGRAPDPEGEAYYLARLRAGTHKLAILKQLRNSPEGRAFVPGVAGLDRAIRRHVWATLPILGALLRLLWGPEGDGATHRALRIVANDVGRLGLEQGRIQAEHSALVGVMQELARGAFARAEASLASSTIGPQPEATPVNSSGVSEQSIEPPAPNLGRHATRMYNLLAKSLQMQQTQGAA